MGAARGILLAVDPWATGIASLGALVALLLEFGFPMEGRAGLLHGVEVGAAAVFALHVALRLGLATDRRAHLRRYWLEAGLLGLLAVQGLVALVLAEEGLLRVTLAAAQVYLLACLVLALARANDRLLSRFSNPAWILVGSFLLLIAAGTGLLLLPLSRAPGVRPWSFTDALFTSASAACVTGLSVRDVGADLSFRGQAVLLVLIQAGGLGLVTVSLLVTLMQDRDVRLRHATLIRDFWSVQTLGDPARFLRRVVFITFGAELLGAALLFDACREAGLSPGERAWWAVFHSVSAFCNAGFGFASDSFARYAGHSQLNLTISGLVVLGGLGFPVIANLMSLELSFATRLFGGRRHLVPDRISAPARLTLHSRLVLRMSALLVAGGAVLFWLSERGHAFAGRPASEAVLASLFQSVNARTAGFSTLDPAAFRPLSLFLIMLLMIVGASPASTGGGVRTTTLAVFWLTLRSMIRGRERVDLFGRSIPRAAVNAAVSILFLYGAAVTATLGLLLATQSDLPFGHLLFESVSAVSTVGLSAGVTPKLDESGRLIVSLAMLVGRVGPLAVLYAVVSRPPSLRHEYPEEPVVVS